MNRIFYCSECKEYTLKKKCPKCGKKTVTPKPARFSPLDRFSKYRIKVKKEKGIIS